MDIETHPFEPFLPEGARILFLGSFPPQPHRWSMPFYYPNWINDFWRIMGLLHFGDKDHFCIPAEKRFDEAAIRAFCTERGLAFYDTACARYHRRESQFRRGGHLRLRSAARGRLHRLEPSGCRRKPAPALLAHAFHLARLSPAAQQKGRSVPATATERIQRLTRFLTRIFR